ncbi:MAG: hypothetical protein K0S46_529 [Moraxellaceae bacterium]|jgi:hypothetical protein|nr:hypothetical protein [Moraxellaceae bacterium]
MDSALQSIREGLQAMLQRHCVPQGMPLLSISVALPVPLSLPQRLRGGGLSARQWLPVVATLQFSLGGACAAAVPAERPHIAERRDGRMPRLRPLPQRRAGKAGVLGAEASLCLHALIRAAQWDTRRALARSLLVERTPAQRRSPEGACRPAWPDGGSREGAPSAVGGHGGWRVLQKWQLQQRPAPSPGGYPALLLRRGDRLAGRCRDLLVPRGAR